MIDLCNPDKIFVDSFPEQFLRDVAHGISDVYSSREEYRLFPEPEMHDAWPIMRRGLIEARIRQIAEGYDGVTATIKTNERNNNHTVIESEHVRLTESMVDSPKKVVRPADFRETLARSNQRFLNGMEDIEPTPSPDAKICAIVIHGESLENSLKVGFIDVVFPTPDGKGYLPPRVHLISYLSDEFIGAGEAVELECVSDDGLVIELRDDLKKEEDA